MEFCKQFGKLDLNISAVLSNFNTVLVSLEKQDISQSAIF